MVNVSQSLTYLMIIRVYYICAYIENRLVVMIITVFLSHRTLSCQVVWVPTLKYCSIYVIIYVMVPPNNIGFFFFFFFSRDNLHVKVINGIHASVSTSSQINTTDTTRRSEAMRQSNALGISCTRQYWVVMTQNLPSLSKGVQAHYHQSYDYELRINGFKPLIMHCGKDSMG